MTVLKKVLFSAPALSRALFYILSPARLRQDIRLPAGHSRSLRQDITLPACGRDYMNIARISLKYGPTVLETAGADTER